VVYRLQYRPYWQESGSFANASAKKCPFKEKLVNLHHTGGEMRPDTYSPFR
jgi:hypothetical protein